MTVFIQFLPVICKEKKFAENLLAHFPLRARRFIQRLSNFPRE